VCCIPRGRQLLRKSIIIAAAVILAPVGLVGLVALAAGDWRQIGITEDGHKVSVSSSRLPKTNLRTTWVRVEYKQPVQLPQGGPFVELRARVRFNCASGKATPSSVWFYSRDHNGKLVVSKKALHDDQFGQAPEGNFADMTMNFVCQQK